MSDRSHRNTQIIDIDDTIIGNVMNGSPFGEDNNVCLWVNPEVSGSGTVELDAVDFSTEECGI